MNTKSDKLGFRGRTIRIRTFRFGVIFFALFAGYLILEALLGEHVFLLNYATVPILAIFYLRFCFKSRKITSVIYAEQNKVDAFKIILTFSRLVLLYLFFTFSFSCLPTIFILSVLNYDNTYDITIFAEIIENYNKTLWLVVPWPHILMMVSFFGILVRRYQVYTIHDLIHMVCDTFLKNDTKHNTLKVIFCGSFLVILMVLLAMAAFSLYLIVCKLLMLPPLSSRSLVSLITVLLMSVTSFVLITKDRIKWLGVYSWSVCKFLLFACTVSSAFLLFVTIVVNLVCSLYPLDLQGGYTHLRSNIKLQCYYFVLVCWWFCLPFIAYVTHKIIVGLTVNFKIFLVFIAMFTTQLLAGSNIVNKLTSLILLGALNFTIYGLLIFLGYTIIIVCYLFYDKHDNSMINMNILFDNGSNIKKMPGSKIYYMYLLTIIVLTMTLMLDNVFLLQRFFEYLPLLNTLIFMYFLSKLKCMNKTEKI